MKLKSNIGTADKIIRLLLAVVFIILVYTNVLSGVFGAVGLILAFLLSATSLVNFCPLYKLLKLNSMSKVKDKTEG